MKVLSVLLKLTLFLFVLFFFLPVGNVDAQSCTGSHTSTGLYQCIMGSDGRYTCGTGGTETAPCSYSSLYGCAAPFYVPENCNLSVDRTSCSVNNRYDGHTTSGCSYTAPPPAPPPPPGSPPPPGGGTCSSGDPYYGIGNCGQVGRVNTGTCGSGCLCCAVSGGGGASPFGCNIQVIRGSGLDPQLAIGSSANIGHLIQNFQGVFNYVRFVNLTPALYSHTPTTNLTSPNGNQGGYRVTVTGVSAGAARVRAEVWGRRCPACSLEVACQATTSFTVGSTAPPPPAPTVDIRANGSNGPITITSGTSATLSWSSSNATSCSASGGWSGTKATSGNESTGNLTANRTYTLTCTGAGGSASDSVTVNVASAPPPPPPPPPAPSVTLRANGSTGSITIAYNTAATLSWTTSNATSCTASGGWSGTKATSGNESTGNLTANRSYTLTCTGAGGSASSSVTVNVAGSPPAPSVTLRANGSTGSITIAYNTAATLSWTTSNATSCTASGGWSGTKATSGNESTGNLTANRSYTLTCTGAGGSASSSVTVNVAAAPTPTPPPPPPPAPTVDIRANGSNGPITIASGTAATLSWSSTNATSCAASGGWSGSRPTSGSTSTGNLTAGRTYTLTCTGLGGTASDSVTVNVSGTPTAPTVDIRANGSNGPITISSGSSATLSWSSTNASSCSASGGWSGSRPTSGSESTGNLTANRTYTLTCTGTGGSASDSVTVNVSTPPGPGVCSQPAPRDPPSVTCAPFGQPNGSVIWRWDAVADANQYEVVILRPDGTVAVSNAWRDAADFGCASSAICSYTTNLPIGSYRSRIRARGLCTASAFSHSSFVSVNQCAPPPLGCTLTSVSPASGTQYYIPENVRACASITNQAGETMELRAQSLNPSVIAYNSTYSIGSPLPPDRYCITPSDGTTVSLGNATISIQAYGRRCPTCSIELQCGTTTTVSVAFPPGWYQVLGGGVLAGGNTISPIPPSCATSPSCIDVLLLDDPVSSVPATVVYGGSTANFSAGAGGGNVSSTGWISNSSTTAGAYSYSYFSNLASGKAFTDVPAGNINTGSVSSAPVDSDGYTWVRVNGNATVAQPLNIDNQKVVLFVDGNLNIANRITLNNTTNSFLMVIARGNITIDPSLSSSSATDYALSGVFFTDGTFATGAANSRLVIRGSVSATNINLQRDLLANNNDTPAERFIYLSSLLINFPSALAEKRLVWREVAP